jgi:glycosyltransferase involved in cell wall biosynthesis
VDEAHSTKWKRNVIRFFVYRLATKVIVVSHALHVSLKNSYRLGERQVTFIPNGINSELYCPDPLDRSRIQQELGLREDNFVVGFSGRLDPVKNFVLLLQIFELCVKEDKRIRLMLIGDGPEKERIKILSQHRGFEEKIFFIGQTDNVLPYLRALDVFLLTSFKEQMPMSLLEAMSVGAPVVASRVGEIPHMVEDGKEGFLCELDDLPQHWAMRLLSLRNPERRRAMGTTARNTVIDRFQQKAMIESYHHLMDGELLNDHNS